ncbi:MAG: class I SAM-dependent methyltransferase [Thermodesulfobacteriota bacterium]|nr:class I SAM-dependent methyltransferase [Thermodesulfobacteriota bacterium]
MDDNNICQIRQTCRICGGNDLRSVIHLGDQHIASVFVKDQTDAWLRRAYPLELVRCAAPGGCGLVQLRHSISPGILYNAYGYRSGTNELMRRNLESIAAKAEAMAGLAAGDTVFDIGCNDGTLLDAFQTPGIDRLGIDPAPNVVASAREKGIEVICDFFSKQAYEAVRPGRKAKVIASIAMFYDLEAPDVFVRDVAGLLADDGVWVIEMVYLPLILQNNSFDTICHEHLGYYSLHQLEWLLAPHGLGIYGVELNAVNGGSIRLFVRKHTLGPVPSVTRQQLAVIRADESALGLDNETPYKVFYRSVCRIRDILCRLLKRIHEDGKTVYIYGASTKGNTILQFCGIDKQLVPKAADRNVEKWGARTPATGIEIISEEAARTDRPDYFLALPWHFMNVFQEREAAFLSRGGRFIVPLPNVRLLGKDGYDEAVDIYPDL